MFFKALLRIIVALALAPLFNVGGDLNGVRVGWS